MYTLTKLLTSGTDLHPSALCPTQTLLCQTILPEHLQGMQISNIS